MDDVQPKQRIKALQNGVRHLADNRWAEATKMTAFQQIVEIDAEQFECDADMSTEDKMFQHVNHIQLVISVLNIAKITRSLLM